MKPSEAIANEYNVHGIPILSEDIRLGTTTNYKGRVNVPGVVLAQRIVQAMQLQEHLRIAIANTAALLDGEPPPYPKGRDEQ